MGKTSVPSKSSAGNVASPGQPRPVCGVCDEESVAAGMLLCKTCEQYYHSECVDITKDTFRSIQPFLQSVGWVCRDCVGLIRDKRKSLFQEFAVVSASLQALRSEHLTLAKKVDELSSQSIVSQPVADVESVVHDHIRRKKNVVVSGLALLLKYRAHLMLRFSELSVKQT